MNIYQRKIAAASLLLFTALPLFFFVFFMGHQKYIQWRMEEKLEHEQLTSITIAETDFRWHKKGKEIIYKDHYFDVKSIVSLPNGEMIITGLYDYQEQKLHQTLSKLVDKESGNQTQKIIHQMFAFVAIEPATQYVFHLFQQILVSPVQYYHQSQQSISYPVIIPPPKVVYC